MKARTPEETANEQTIRKLYSLAEAAHKDTPGFVRLSLRKGKAAYLKGSLRWTYPPY